MACRGTIPAAPAIFCQRSARILQNAHPPSLFVARMRRLPILVLALLTGAGTLAAQEPPDTLRRDSLPAPMPVRGLTVAVPRALATAGGASAVEIRLDSVSPGPAPSMADLLRGMPLIQIRRNSRGEAQPALRGAEDRQVAVLVDGVPLTLGWDARTDLSVIPLTAARRVRLVRGLATVLHGPNVLGGAVEVDVARGSQRFAPPDPVSVQTAVEHTGTRSLAVTGGRLMEGDGGQWEVRAGTGYRESDGMPLPSGLGPEQRQRFLTRDGDLRLNSDLRRVDGFASARYRADGGAWFSAAGSAYQVERGVPPEAHLDEPRLWRYPHQSRFFLATSAGTGFHDTSWGRGDLEASVGLDLGRSEIDAFASEAYDEIVGGEDADDRTVTLRMTGDLAPGARTDLRAALTYADVFHRERIAPDPAAEYRQRLWSLGLEGERDLGRPLGLGPTRLVAGLAVDGADTPLSADKPPLDRLWDWGGRVGVSSLAAGGRLLVHGSVSRRTRFPALRELYSGALGRFEPNPGLGPEEMTAAEVGATLEGGGTELQVVAFHQRLDDGIVRTSVATPDGPKFKRINQDQVLSTGLELLARGRLGPLVLDGDLTLQRVRGRTADGDQVRLEYEPALVGGVGVQAPLPAALLAMAQVDFMSRQSCENPERGGLVEFRSDPRMDVGLQRRFQWGGGGTLGRMEARLAVDNVTDAAVLDQCGLPGPGRLVSLQVRLW